MGEHQVKKERDMHARLEEINAELLPLEQVRSQFDFMYFVRSLTLPLPLLLSLTLPPSPVTPHVCIGKRKAATQQAAVELL